MIFVGVDWAEAHHDVYVKDEDGKRLAGGRLPEGVEGIARSTNGRRPCRGSERSGIGIETDRGLFVGALVAAGYRGVRGQPLLDVALSGSILDLGGQVRPRRRQGAGRLSAPMAQPSGGGRRQ